jgi:hypothetical protein
MKVRPDLLSGQVKQKSGVFFFGPNPTQSDYRAGFFGRSRTDTQLGFGSKKSARARPDFCGRSQILARAPTTYWSYQVGFFRTDRLRFVGWDGP